jgi:hypothetical protein
MARDRFAGISSLLSLRVVNYLYVIAIGTGTAFP